jgi:hypothetical protein
MAVVVISDHKPFPKVVSVTIGLKETFFKVSENSQTFYSKVAETTKSC